jgi:cell wall-associated NlpC family hydrolase
MLSDLISPSNCGEYSCLINLDLYAQPDCQELATQALAGRQLKFITHTPVAEAIAIGLCEDNYSAWLPLIQLKYLQPATKPYQARSYSRQEIVVKIPQVIEFAKQAMNTPNYYLWGGTVAPNYDCSGLIQSAFASVGIWLPRDSYQQEEFTQRINQQELQTGDLIFFGIKRVTHVALYLDNGLYLHSSGKEIGNNKIAINSLTEHLDPVSSNYYQQLWSFGRIMNSL